MGDIKDAMVEQIPRLRRYARALVGDAARADDLVQDTLERAWTRRLLWRRGSDLRAWLFTIMHNLYVNQLRQQPQGKMLVSLEEEGMESPSPESGDAHLEMHDLVKALARLPADQREVLLLVALEEMRYEDVARVLAIPPGTVMSRLSRARARLRTLMAGQAAPVLRRVK